jgi:hypothetical protein
MDGPHFQAEGFGWLMADGRRYAQDVIVTADGDIQPRPKHLSKKYGGWHTVLGPEEMASVLSTGLEVLVVGRGHFNQLPIRRETLALLAERGVELELLRIPRALRRYEQLRQKGRRVAAILHLTC